MLDDNNAVDSNVDIDTEAKTNPNDNKTGKDNKDFCKNDSMINIEDLFQQVRNQTACEKLTSKVLEQTYRFFQHPISKISLLDQMPICGLKCGLKPFQAFGVFYMFLVEVTPLSGGILVSDMGFGKVRHLLEYF